MVEECGFNHEHRNAAVITERRVLQAIRGFIDDIG
jgi:hypothetical protein